MNSFGSWGRYPPASHAVIHYEWRHDPLPRGRYESLLPYGQGRSYGDLCLNNGAAVISTQRLNRLISFDVKSGLLRCEAGVTLGEILQFSVPRGWFLPVTPGTKFVTVGGAIAADVHGKNHHRAGTFGCHVRAFELLRSDGSRNLCTPAVEQGLFRSTIGGMGLTGLITWVDLQLKPINSPMIRLESTKFDSLDEFFAVSRAAERRFEYSVAWLDCLASGKGFGRGILMCGNHSDEPFSGPVPRSLELSVPLDLPAFVLNSFTVRAFNFLYYSRQFEKVKHSSSWYDPFFYPLDSVGSWNRIYGRRGFFQFQCVVPSAQGKEALQGILREITRSGAASFLAVLKEFGAMQSPGMMSFPRPGVTLALDFANRGTKTLKLLERLEEMVNEAGGALYPAKDACMKPASFRRYYPNLAEFGKFVDPGFSSSFWRRIVQEEA